MPVYLSENLVKQANFPASYVPIITWKQWLSKQSYFIFPQWKR